MNKKLITIFLCMVTLSACSALVADSQNGQRIANDTLRTTADGREEVVNNVSLASDLDTAKIPLSDLIQGCFGKDCIPSIDEPDFEDQASAGSWMSGLDTVFVL